MTTITSWLPSGVVFADVISGATANSYNMHLEWSALGGLAVALLLLRRGSVRLAGVALWWYVAADHAASNWVAAGQPGFLFSMLATPFTLLRHLLLLMPAVALGIARWLDRPRQRRAADSELA